MTVKNKNEPSLFLIKSHSTAILLLTTYDL